MRSLDLLIPEAKEAAIKTLKFAHDEGVDLLIYATLRPLEEQAVLYRQSRTRTEIAFKMQKMRDRGFGFLADVIERVGPRNGPKRTNAAPGESFHNYGRAFDAVPVHNGKLMWPTRDDEETLDFDEGWAWEVYGNAAEAAGLEWAGRWVSFREYAHSQIGKGSNPLKTYKPDFIHGILTSNGLLKE